MRSASLSVLIAMVPALACAQEMKPFRSAIEFNPSAPPALNPADFLFSPEVLFDGKDIRLARSVLLTHETGTTDHHQGETLSPTVWAKVLFDIAAPPKEDAELFVYGTVREAALNNEPLPTASRLVSTGWSRIPVPARLLRAGVNDIVLRGGGSLLVEPGRPGRSFKSVDAGKSWSRDNLTGAADVAGEYLVRLRLPQHSRRGWAMTRPIDLWADTPLASARSVDTIYLPVGESDVPKTKLRYLLRLGGAPATDDKSWTPWRPVTATGPRPGKVFRVPADEGKLRWAQLKIELETDDPNVSPRVAGDLSVHWDGKKTGATASAVKIKIEPRPEELLPQGVPFLYEKPIARLDHLRKRYKLDEVIAPGKTEMEQFMLLRYWIRNQWHTAWQSHSAGWIPPWDSLIILECRDQPECLTMCTHYGCVFTQCAQALGWNARHCILDHHCVSEVYSVEHDRWIMMDTGNSAERADVGLHFERKGVPLSARELQFAYYDKKLDGITVHFTPKALAAKIQHMCRPAPKGKSDPARPDVITLAELKKFPVCQIENYRRYAFPGRNTFLTSLLPGELYHGYAEYFHDGYYWVGDSPDRPTISPEYSRPLDPRRPQDADWKLGGVRVHLSDAGRAGQVAVDLESLMPNHARFEIQRDGKWTATAGRFVLETKSGLTTQVRAVNAWGKAGRATTIEMK